MAMGRRTRQTQTDFWILREHIQHTPAHPFYTKLNQLLAAAGFDPFCETTCQKFYADTAGRPSVPPGVYFRMLLLGYFEKLDSERQIAWRCADSLALRSFLGYELDRNTPDHSSLSRTRNRIDLETHEAIFHWVLKRLAEHNLLSSGPLGIDASTLEADAAMKSIVRRDGGATYKEYITNLAQASGIETPTEAELIAFDRKRKNKSASNDDWQNPHDPDAKIAKLKDGRTHLAYKNEHAVDLQSGAIVAVEIHSADQGDTSTIAGTLEKAAESYEEVRSDEQVAANCKANGGTDVGALRLSEVVADKGYHSAQTLVDLEEAEIRGLIAEPDRGRQNWRVKATRGMSDAERAQQQEFKRIEQSAVYRNRRRIRGKRSKSLHRRRGELVERSFEHVLDDGGMRRTWLKGRVKVAKRYLVHVAGFNLGLVMRKLSGFGTPRGWASSSSAAANAVRVFLAQCEACARSVAHRISKIVFGVPAAHRSVHSALAA